MKIVGFTRVVEKDGWLHELAIELDNGATVLISDDTDCVDVHSDRQDAMTPAQAVTIWSEYAMGCSHFPAKPVPENLPEGTDIFHQRTYVKGIGAVEIYSGGGVQFSHLAP